jgi:hypothetical protein
VRRICTSCREPYEPSEEELAFFTASEGAEPRRCLLPRGVGCNFCAGTGYLERIGVYELLKSILQYEISGPRIKRRRSCTCRARSRRSSAAGLPILEAVHTIGAESENSSVRRMMNEIEDGLRTGERFSDCLDRYPKVFPPFYRGIVRSAELTGELDTVLTRLRATSSATSRPAARSSPR